jgi:hypothetical protein
MSDTVSLGTIFTICSSGGPGTPTLSLDGRQQIWGERADHGADFGQVSAQLGSVDVSEGVA